ncbi:MAG: NAD(P)-dependent oxidoreductase [Spirochaetota bacterium]
MKIVFHTHLAVDFSERIAAFAARFPDHDFVVAAEEAELVAAIPNADVLVDHRITPDLLDAAGELKWVFVPFTGVNTLPWELLNEHGVQVSNNHGNAAIVAERALALALASMGRVAEFDRGMRRGHWFRRDESREPFVMWTSLLGARVSILGTGAIGSAIARLVAPFTDDVVGFRRRSSAEVPPHFRSVSTDLHEALSGARVCFVALPHTAATDSLLGEEELVLLEGAFLVNVSRGSIVAERPLYDALAQGRLAGAGIDAWYTYPNPFASDAYPSGYPFHELENVVLSPHAGSHAPEGKLGQLEGTLKNLAALIETGRPLDVVDRSAGY